jgi:hypothetical protein
VVSGVSQNISASAKRVSVLVVMVEWLDEMFARQLWGITLW